MDTNRLVVLIAGIVAALVVLVIAVPPMFTKDRSAAPDANAVTDPGTDNDPGNEAVPTIDGQPLASVTDESRPPPPTQWASGNGPIPSNTWWSSAVTGPGATSLWPQPLGLTITPAGEVQIAAPLGQTRADGSTEAPFVPALFLELGAPATTRVVDHGPLHVTIRVQAGRVRMDLTLIQGSPLVEIHTTDTFQIRAPGLAVTTPPLPEAESFHFGTSEGPWLVAASEATVFAPGNDLITVQPTKAGRLVLGPVPKGSGASYDAQARSVAARPLTATAEHLQVAPDGTTTQVLSQTRGSGSSLWALQPQHQKFAVNTGAPSGTVASPRGTLPVVAGAELRLVYPAVPILWSAVPAPGADRPSAEATATPVIEEGTGSYFGGKVAYANAARADLFRSAGQRAPAESSTAETKRLLDQLLAAKLPPALRWDSSWGSVIVEPAEFGSGTELNDHQLQYGYWVAAAAHVAEADPDAADRYRDMIDLLIADYAGAATMPDAPKSLPAERTWSPYEGHSWASGTAPFGAGNNLESVSESNLAWWAAARWMIATGRAQDAEVFIGRFTIESALAGYYWLPQGDQLSADSAHRPWSGVVWSSKIDASTWFDPNDESALGIRLVPLGPAAVARYSTTEAIDAAKARWDWCESYGNGCTVRWANLLDSDAAVAGRPLIAGPDPEPSTTPVTAAWWRDLWDRTSAVQGWSCSVGAVARAFPDGTVAILASSPGPNATKMSCHDGAGTLRWTGWVKGSLTATASPRS